MKQTMEQVEEPRRFVDLGRKVWMLPCKLTREELLERGQRLAVYRQDIDAEEDRQKEIRRQLKETLEALEEVSRRLVLAINTREEPRDVEVRITGDLESGVVEVVRGDTGEVIETRRMTESERQQALPLEELEEGPDPVRDGWVGKDGRP